MEDILPCLFVYKKFIFGNKMTAMKEDKQVHAFLSSYAKPVQHAAEQLRTIVAQNLPDIIEQVDLPAKMIGYCYGQKYAHLICTIIPSQKGLKLGFNKGTELHDPEKCLEGTGKISRYMVIDLAKPINKKPLHHLLAQALELYKARMATIKK